MGSRSTRASPRVADGTGATVAGVPRQRHDYGQVAIVAELWRKRPQDGIAFERFTPGRSAGAAAAGGSLRTRLDRGTGARRSAARACRRAFLAQLEPHFGAARARLRARRGRGARFRSRSNTRPRRSVHACVVLGNAAQTLHPVAGQGFNVGLRDAYELAQAIVDAPRDTLGEPRMLAVMRAAGAPIAGRASRSRTVSSTCSATTLRSCAGRAGWRSLCSTRCRRRSARSRGRCCSDCVSTKANARPSLAMSQFSRIAARLSRCDASMQQIDGNALRNVASALRRRRGTVIIPSPPRHLPARPNASG